MSGCAWVTLATNDSYSLGALVLAHSLRKSNTAHKVVVLITPGVSEPMRDELESTFDLVKSVDVLESKDEVHLALMKRPELGVTFTKIHCWTLTEFEKCVFLDADILVVRNCDELFEREELSAAPDVGWPDCFNSGVFVYRPSIETFKRLLQFAIDQGSFDGGDQGLLNEFFSDWATEDIRKHLPFVYNLTSVAVYSYIPAFKRYGSETRIVHFIGSGKPWLHRLDPVTRTITPNSGSEHLGPLLEKWWDIFWEKVHPSLNKDLEKETNSQPLEVDACCDSNPPLDHSQVPEKPRLLEPVTPYREEKDYRQFNLPYLPFDVKGSSGELLNIGFRLPPDDYDRTIIGECQIKKGPKAQYEGTCSEGSRDALFLETQSPGSAEGLSFLKSKNNDSKSSQVRRPGSVPDGTSNDSQQVSQEDSRELKNDRPNQENVSSVANIHEPDSNSPFHLNTFCPDDECVNSYLEQNVLRYQPFHSQKLVAAACPSIPTEAESCDEKTRVLPRFLTMPEDDKRQSGNYSVLSLVKEARDRPPAAEEVIDTNLAAIDPGAELKGKETQHFPLTNAVTAAPSNQASVCSVVTFPKSKSMSQLFFDASSVKPFSSSSSWQVSVPADIHRRFSLPKLKPLLPKGNALFKSTPEIFPKVTQYTEFLMSADYKDPIGLPTDKEGFFVHDAIKECHLKRSKSEASLDRNFGIGNGRGTLCAESDTPPNHSSYYTLYDLKDCKRQIANRPNHAGINCSWYLSNNPVRKRTTTSHSDNQRNNRHRKRTKKEGSSAKDRRKGESTRSLPIFPSSRRPDSVQEVLNRLIGFSNNYLHYFHDSTNKPKFSSTFEKSLHGSCIRDATVQTLKSFYSPAQSPETEHPRINLSGIKYSALETPQLEVPVTSNEKSPSIGNNFYQTTPPKRFQRFRNYVQDQCKTIRKGLLGFQYVHERNKRPRRQRPDLSSPGLTGNASFQTNRSSFHDVLGDSETKQESINSCRALIKYTDVQRWNRKFQMRYQLNSTNRLNKTSTAIPLPWPNFTTSGSNSDSLDLQRTNKPPRNPPKYAQRKSNSPVPKEVSPETLPSPTPPRKNLNNPPKPSPLTKSNASDYDISPEGTTTSSGSQISNHEPLNPLSINKMTRGTADSSTTAGSRNSFLGYNHRQDAKSPIDASSNNRPGIAGAIGQIRIDTGDSLGNLESSARQEYMRRQNWETGNMDYMGRDSFDNIWAKICQTLEEKPPQIQSTSPAEIQEITKLDKAEKKTSLPDSSSQFPPSETESEVTDVQEAVREVLSITSSIPSLSTQNLQTSSQLTAMSEMQQTQSGTSAQLSSSTPIAAEPVVPATNLLPSPPSSLASLPSNPPVMSCKTAAHQLPLLESVASEPCIPPPAAKSELPPAIKPGTQPLPAVPEPGNSASGILSSSKVSAQEHVAPQASAQPQPPQGENVASPQAVTPISFPLEPKATSVSPPSQQVAPVSTPNTMEGKPLPQVEIMPKIKQTSDPDVLSKSETANDQVAITNITSSQVDCSSLTTPTDSNGKPRQHIITSKKTEEKPFERAQDRADTDEKTTAIVPYCDVFESVKNPEASDVRALKESHRKTVKETIKNQAYAKADQFPPIPMPESPTEPKRSVPLNNMPQPLASEFPTEGIQEDSPKDEGNSKKGMINKILQIVGVTPKGKPEIESYESTPHDQQSSTVGVDALQLKGKSPPQPSSSETVPEDSSQIVTAAALQITSSQSNDNRQFTKPETEKPEKDSANQNQKGDKKSSKKNKGKSPKPPPLPEKKRNAKKPESDNTSDTPSKDTPPQPRPTQKDKSKPKQDKQTNAGPKKPQRPTEAKSSEQPPPDAPRLKNKSSSPTLSISEPLPCDTIEPQNLISIKNPALLTIDDSIPETPPAGGFTETSPGTLSSTQKQLKTEIDAIIDKAKTVAEYHQKTAQDLLSSDATIPQPAQDPNALNIITAEGKSQPQPEIQPLNTDPKSKSDPTKQNQRGHAEQKPKRGAQKHPARPDQIEQLNLTTEEQRKNHRSDHMTSKLSDQILKAIPPPRRKAISDAKTQAKAAATNTTDATLEHHPQKQAPNPTKTGTHKPKAPVDPVPPPRNRSKPRQNTPPEPNSNN